MGVVHRAVVLQLLRSCVRVVVITAAVIVVVTRVVAAGGRGLGLVLRVVCSETEQLALEPETGRRERERGLETDKSHRKNRKDITVRLTWPHRRHR